MEAAEEQQLFLEAQPGYRPLTREEIVEMNKRSSDEESTTIKKFTIVNLRERKPCLLYTSPSPRDLSTSRMPSSA